jgi:hypothetical protein
MSDGADFTDAFTENLGYFKDMALDSAEAIGGVVTGAIGWTDAATDAASATEEYNKKLKEFNLISSGSASIDRQRAEAALTYLRDVNDSVKAATDAGNAMRSQTTEAEKLTTALRQMSKVNQDVLNDPKSLEALEANFENLKSAGIIASNVAFDMGKGFSVAAQASERLSVNLAALEKVEGYVKDMTAIQNRGVQDENILNLRTEIAQITQKISEYDIARQGTGARLTQNERNQLE